MDGVADKRVYTFTLRKGVKFHDGTKFTSAAVEGVVRAAHRGQGRRRLHGRGRQEASTRSDPYKAVITLKAPNAAFLDYLASPFGPKMESPTGMAKNAGSDHAQTYLRTHDIGSGPYELTPAQTGTKYGLKQFDGYWGPKSPFTRSTCRSTRRLGASAGLRRR